MSLSLLSHCCAAVRASMAQHLHQLAGCPGAACVFAAGRTFTECFLLAGSRMCVDGAPDMRWVISFYRFDVTFCNSFVAHFVFVTVFIFSFHRHHKQIILLELAHQKDFPEPMHKDCSRKRDKVFREDLKGQIKMHNICNINIGRYLYFHCFIVILYPQIYCLLF